MDRQGGPPLSILRGQLKLGLKEEVRKETLPEEVFAFVRGFLFYCQRRLSGAFRLLWSVFASSFTVSSGLKSQFQGKLYRRGGQLSFPLVHASLLGISFSLLIFTSGFGEFLYKQIGASDSGERAVVIQDQPSIATEESQLFQTEITLYTVKEDDTLSSIAERFGITVDTLRFANDITDVDYLKVGRKLSIPPSTGVVHRVKSGDTLAEIAEQYKVTVQRVMDYNYLFSNKDLKVGMELVIPGGQIPLPPRPSYSEVLAGSKVDIASSGGYIGSGQFIWPTPGYYQYGGSHHWSAIDTALVGYSVRVVAMDSGTVTAVGGYGWSGCYLSYSAGYDGYGYRVKIDHGNGLTTLYAHLSKWTVSPGQRVVRGQTIGYTGMTGCATNYHLHFAVLQNGYPITRSISY